MIMRATHRKMMSRPVLSTFVGIEVGQVGGLLGPAERGERPERRAEPRVQHVGLAGELGGAALGAGLRLGLGHREVAVRAVPHRQLVTPPELPADAPRPQVVHPVDVHAAPALGRELDLAVADDVRRRPLELVHVHEPLLADERLDGRAATVAGGDAVRVVLDLDQGAERAQVRGHALGGLLDLEAGVRAAGRGDAAVLADGLDGLQAVRAADVEVGEVVRRRDLEGAGAEGGVDALVRHDLELAPEQRQEGRLADEVLVPLVVGVHGHGGVAEHGLGARGGDGHAAAADDLVADVVERAGHVPVRHLEVADGRAAARAPVHEVAVLVDVALLVERHEDLGDGARVARRRR